MNWRRIRTHAKKHFEKEQQDIGYQLPWELRRTSEDYVSSHLQHYARRILEKKRLLGEETKSELYLILGNYSLKSENYGDAKRYFILAKRADLIKTLEETRKGRIMKYEEAFKHGSENPYSNN